MGFLTNLTLQKRISLLVFVCLAMGLGLFSWLSIRSLNQSTQRTLDERLTIARIVGDHLDETLNHILAEVQNAADFGGALPSEEQFRESTRSVSAMLADTNVLVKGGFLLDPAGKVLLSEPPHPESAGVDLVSQIASNGVVIDSPFISSLTRTPLVDIPVVFVTVPVVDSASNSIGALSLAIDIGRSNIGGFIKPIVLGKTGYTELVDGNGIVLARAEPGSPLQTLEVSDHPGRFAQLITQGKAIVRTCHRCHGEETGPPRRKDILAFAPLSNASWGVAIRQSEGEAFAITNQLKTRLLILGGVLLAAVGFLMWIVVRGVVRPIEKLTATVPRIARGDFKDVQPMKRRDEIGQLSTAFATMARDLGQAQDKLVARNTELLALNSIASTVSQSLDLEEVLTKATGKVLEITGSDAGCVFVAGGEGRGLKLVSCVGPGDLFRCAQASSPSAGCACQEVWQTGQPLMVNHASQCPRLVEEAEAAAMTNAFASIPLKSKRGTLGVMNIRCARARCFTEDDFKILVAIGHHVGLAVENSMLYQEARQKEELRGQLLNAVISAQEDERKRVSRELHDGLGQTLTGLIMNIEAANAMTSPGQASLGEKLGKTRTIAGQALEDMRKLLRDLRPPALDDLGLVAGIRSYAENHLDAAGVRLDFQADLGQHLPQHVETAVFRLVQEAVNNIVKHAGARSARIQLGANNGMVTIVVEDDGRGFDVVFPGPTPSGSSLGLVSMRERVALLGGKLSVNSVVGAGTRLVMEIPMDTGVDSVQRRGEKDG